MSAAKLGDVELAPTGTRGAQLIVELRNHEVSLHWPSSLDPGSRARQEVTTLRHVAGVATYV